MTEQLTGKTAIVTGASSGIGAAIAKELVKSGANVVLAARNEERLAAIIKDIGEEGKTLSVIADMTNQVDVDALKDRTVETFGNVDIYVNNAGVMGTGSVLKGTVSDWDHMIDTNIKGVLYGVHSILPEMVEKKSGHIVNISSIFGYEVLMTSTVYSATKFAVRAISMGLEKELAGTGVRVSNISPGVVETPLTSKSPFPSKGKKLEAADIGRAVVYALIQPDYVNVNEIVVRTIWQ